MQTRVDATPPAVDRFAACSFSQTNAAFNASGQLRHLVTEPPPPEELSARARCRPQLSAWTPPAHVATAAGDGRLGSARTSAARTAEHPRPFPASWGRVARPKRTQRDMRRRRVAVVDVRRSVHLGASWVWHFVLSLALGPLARHALSATAGFAGGNARRRFGRWRLDDREHHLSNV